MIKYIRRFDYRLWILAGGWVASSTGFSLAYPFLSLYFHSHLGMSLLQIGLYFGVAALFRASFQAIGGELSDKVGRYWLMILAQFLRTISFMFLAWAIYKDMGFLIIGILVIINSIFGSIFQPAANATVADLTPQKDRPEAYSIVRAAGNFGWALGPAVGGHIAESSYAILFVVSGGMTLVSSTIIALFLKGIRNKSANNDEPFKLKDIATIRHDKLFFRHFLLLFLLYLVFSQLMAPFALYTVSLKGLSKEDLGLLFTMNGIMVTVLQVPITILIRKMRLTLQIVSGALILAIAFCTVGLSGTFMVLAVAMFAITMGELFHSPPALSLTTSLAPPGRTGRYMGAYGFALTAGWSLGPLLGTSLLDFTAPHYEQMWFIISGMALLTAAGYYRLSRKIPRERDSGNV